MRKSKEYDFERRNRLNVLGAKISDIQRHSREIESRISKIPNLGGINFNNNQNIESHSISNDDNVMPLSQLVNKIHDEL